jgi:beta-mannosidase
MRSNFLYFYLLPLLMLTACKPPDKNPVQKAYRQYISDWSFKASEAPYTAFRRATVPGNIYTDLQTHALIPDPFFGTNEDSVQWVGRTHWDYRVVFTPEAGLMDKKNVRLVFEGLDTYADVYLNDQLLFRGKNMFTRYTAEVDDILLDGINELVVTFTSPVLTDSVLQAAHPFLYPDPRSFTRKAPYQYGWDWGPRLAGMGIWKPVYLEAPTDPDPDHFRVVTDSLGVNQAYLSLIFRVKGRPGSTLRITGNPAGSKKALFQEKRTLTDNVQSIQIPFILKDPELWWPNGMGTARLQELNVSLETSGFRFDTTLVFGIRTIELVREPDSLGETFYFKINGQPVFVRGANYIPQHSFPSQVTQAQAKRLLTDARMVGMNMLRVWGGGIYPDDHFYALCDSLGLMVWQDFMFACNFYPGDTSFLKNVATEVRQQVVRLSGRPSLALWCGNNEVDEAWHNWGYQESLNYSLHDQERIWTAYQNLFDTLIPGIVRQITPRVDYIPSSPRIGWGHEEALYEGDMHYWGVWWGAEPFEIYREKTGRFMSEYGFQAFPAGSMLTKYIPGEIIDLNEAGLLNHQKHPRGMALIREYMERDFKVPEDPLSYLYVSQLVQELGMRIAIEAHRKAKPSCMGTLYWQLNDCWPAISWSGIDFEGNWKALHYSLNRLYANQLLVVDEQSDSWNMYLINEDPQLESGRIRIRLLDFAGNSYLDTIKNTPISVHEAIRFGEMRRNEFPEGLDERSAVMVLDMDAGLNAPVRTLHYFVRPKSLLLAPAILNVVVREQTKNRLTVEIHSDVLVKNLYLPVENICQKLSDNFFDLLPGETKELIFEGFLADSGADIRTLKGYSLNPSLEIRITGTIN